MPALIIAAALAATPIGSQPCANALVQPTAAAGAPSARKLGDLPPARLMHLVLRRVPMVRPGPAIADTGRQLIGDPGLSERLARLPCPFGDGKATERIAACIQRFLR